MGKNIFKLFVILLFALILALPTIQVITHFIPEPEMNKENRALTPMPSFELKTINEFPTKFDQFFNDHFPLRGLFLAVSHNIKLALGISPTTSTIIGKNNFMYAGYYKNSYTSKPQNDTIAQQFANILKERKDSLQAMGIKLYVVVVPTNYQIYPEYLPEHIVRADTTQIDLVCKAMQEIAPDVNFIYPKEELIANKKWGQLYRKYDTHWNSKGGYIGAKEILSLIHNDFKNLSILGLHDFIFKYELQTKGDLVDPLLTGKSFLDPLFNGGTSKYFEPDTLYNITYTDTSNKIRRGISRNYTKPAEFPYTYECEFVTNKTNAPKLFVIRDSYWSYLQEFICPHFSETICIWDKWHYAANYDLISQEKPDIVLLEIFEPQIKNLVNNELGLLE
ncbi:MAG: hypothetical protein MJ204_00515 [Bacteroidales bacterium]|nr:hypothetical protein [Bacteroidales bacterium]